MERFDAVVIGGGPAGLSAALVLSRARRKVVVLDHGKYRNACSHGLHGYLTRDGIEPSEFLRLAREEIAHYSVPILAAEANDVLKNEDFEVHAALLESGTEITIHARLLLIATGLRDRLPEIEGMRDVYGTSAHHCPHCDGWEWRDQSIAILAHGPSAFNLSTELLNWSRDLVLCTNGRSKQVPSVGIPVITKRIVKLEQEDGFLRKIWFHDGTGIERRALFFVAPQEPSCNIARTLGCTVFRKGLVRTDGKQRTNVGGLYVAGDAMRDVHFAILAAAEGARAAIAMNAELTRSHRPHPDPGVR